MFWKVAIVFAILYIIREVCVAPIIRILFNCEDTLHHLYRYCAISQSNPYFLDYYKADQELKQREDAVKRIDELKISKFRKSLMSPGERKYYEEFVSRISSLKDYKEKCYTIYRNFQERYVQENVKK